MICHQNTISVGEIEWVRLYEAAVIVWWAALVPLRRTLGTLACLQVAARKWYGMERTSIIIGLEANTGYTAWHPRSVVLSLPQTLVLHHPASIINLERHCGGKVRVIDDRLKAEKARVRRSPCIHY
jgi:hypothetical protein